MGDSPTPFPGAALRRVTMQDASATDRAFMAAIGKLSGRLHHGDRYYFIKQLTVSGGQPFEDHITPPPSPLSDGTEGKPFMDDDMPHELDNRLGESTAEIKAKRGTIQGIYEELLSQTVTAARDVQRECRGDFHIIKQEIEDQKHQFDSTTQSLIQISSNASLGEAMTIFTLHAKILNEFAFILPLLEDAKVHLQNIFSDFKDRDNPSFEEERRRRAREPSIQARGVLQNNQRFLKTLDRLARPLVENRGRNPNQANHVVSPIELKRLEGLAATAFFQCFCQVCPEEAHQSHTAYLRLVPGDQAGPGTELQMAVRPRIRRGRGLIWLKVVSVVHERASVDTNNAEVPATPTGHPGRKRALASKDVTLPPGKALKMDGGRVMRWNPDPTEERPPSYPPHSLIQVCPEYLAQHESDLLVMQMRDASDICHSVYFLPEQKRPLEEHEPISLESMLQNQWRSGKTLSRRRRLGLLWIVKVARQIAEAVPRFDWRESTCQWDKENVIFYAPQDPTGDLEPFLKVEIERRLDRGHSALDHHRSTSHGRNNALLSLCLILLQLGSRDPWNIPLEHTDDETCRDDIQKLTDFESAEDYRVPPEYLMVVRQCANLSRSEENGAREQEFWEKYYQFIVSPLKRMEQDLLKLRQRFS